MKKFLVLLPFFYLYISCNPQKSTSKETVSNYYSARDASDYQKLKTYVSDSITIVEGDFIMPYSRDSYHTEFKWDSIFGTAYKIVELAEDKNEIIATVASSSVRLEFLKNSPLTCQYKLSFQEGKISKIEMLDCIGTDWNRWQEERDTLVSWIKVNHPELDGFINDMTMEGAIKYTKAMNLFKDRIQ